VSTLLCAEALQIGATDKGGTIPVLRDVDFRLERGQILGLVGESGAGKSMIARAIAADLPPGFAVQSGALRYGAEDLVRMSAPRRRALLGQDMTFIPQEPMAALNPVLTVWQQMREHLVRLREARSTMWARACDLLKQVGLDDPAILRRYPHQLSGGMCQRVLIALAFASDPHLVVADEPTTALDVTTQARVVRLLAEMQARCGTGVLFITHDLRLAAGICHDVLVLYAGRPAERGPARLLFLAPSHPYTACLQLAAPALTGPRRALMSLPFQMPGLRDIAAMAGCRFAPRCPVAQADCREVEPSMLEVGRNHLASCLHSEMTAMISEPMAADPPTTRTSTMEVLRTEAVGRVFGSSLRWFGRPQVVAVRGADIVVRQGEFVGLVGESGSGKSTIARLVAGLERPSSGRILLSGLAAPGREERRQLVQMVFQDPQSALNPRRLVVDIVTQALDIRQAVAPAERRARAADLLAQVGLPAEVMTRFPGQLSGGQRQRVNIARALCVTPRLLVADEIVSGLDVSVQAQLLDMLLELRARLGFAMLFISHDLAVVRYLCPRVLVMHQGEIVEQGPTLEVFAKPAHPYTRALLEAVPSGTQPGSTQQGQDGLKKIRQLIDKIHK
jgi:peptide/nickel transport system ATP-binding protein